MKLRFRSGKSLMSQFSRREDGAATVEAVLWIPVFLVLFALIVDATLILSGQTRATRIVQDANRGVSIGQFQTLEQAETFLASRVAHISTTAAVNMVIEGGIITTTVLIPSRDLVAIGLLEQLRSFDVRVSAQHLVEF